MSERTAFGPRSFAWTSAAVAVFAALVVVAVLGPRGVPAVAWGLTGWAAMATVGTIGGIGLVSSHGRPAVGFLGTLVGATLARLAIAAVLGVAAARAGEALVWPYLTGLAAGYFPLQLVEVAWLVRRTRIA
jgi:hypothetical protein